MSSLFEITAEFRALYDMATEDEEAFADSLESLNFDLEQKSAGYVAVINRLEMEAAKARDMSAMFADKAKVRENNIKRLKSAMLMALEASGNQQIDADGFTIKIKKNGGVQPLVIDQPNNVPDSMTKIIIEADKKKIRDFLKDNTCDWAHLEPRGKHLEIK